MCQSCFSVKLMEDEAANSYFGKKCFDFERNSKKPTDLLSAPLDWLPLKLNVYFLGET